MTPEIISWREVEGETLTGLWYPAEEERWLLVDVHGGAWSSGDARQGAHLHAWLRTRGVSVFAINFRQAPAHRHPAATLDIAAALAWVEAGGLGHVPQRVGLIGSSSGGHLALLTAVTANEARSVERVIALWPVSNPLARYQYVLARAADPDRKAGFTPARLARGHEAYFGDVATMHAAAIQQVLTDGTATALPAALVVQPERDQNVPLFMSQTLAGAWRHAGGSMMLSVYPGVEHGFALRPGPQTAACFADIAAFLAD